jgi:hypothetical protein
MSGATVPGQWPSSRSAGSTGNIYVDKQGAA